MSSTSRTVPGKMTKHSATPCPPFASPSLAQHQGAGGVAKPPHLVGCFWPTLCSAAWVETAASHPDPSFTGETGDVDAGYFPLWKCLRLSLKRRRKDFFFLFLKIQTPKCRCYSLWPDWHHAAVPLMLGLCHSGVMLPALSSYMVICIVGKRHLWSCRLLLFFFHSSGVVSYLLSLTLCFKKQLLFWRSITLYQNACYTAVDYLKIEIPPARCLSWSHCPNPATEMKGWGKRGTRDRADTVSGPVLSPITGSTAGPQDLGYSQPDVPTLHQVRRGHYCLGTPPELIKRDSFLSSSSGCNAAQAQVLSYRHRWAAAVSKQRIFGSRGFSFSLFSNSAHFPFTPHGTRCHLLSF